jgi:hypothetical protein
MSDRLRDIGLALLGLALLNSAAKVWSEQALEKSLREQMRGGRIHVRVESSGLYGMLVGRAALARVTGTGVRIEELPFLVRAGGGMRSEVRSVRLDLRDVTFRGLDIRRMSVDLPDVSLDVDNLLFHDRLVLRRAGGGRVSFGVAPESIAAFARRRYPALQDVEVRLSDGEVRLAAALPLFGTVRRISAQGGLQLDEGGRVVLKDPDVRLDGRPTEPGLRSALLSALGPLLDVERDLGLRDVLRLDRVEVRAAELLLSGQVTIAPRAGPA